MKNVLITGSSGFIGRNFKKFALTQGWNVYEPTGKIGFGLPNCLPMDVYKVSMDYIFHFADTGGTVEFCSQNSGHIFATNVNMHLWLLEAWRQKWPHARFVGISSAWAYPHLLQSLYEHDMFAGPVDKKIEAYAHSKHTLITGLATYKKQYRMRGTILTLGTTYGPDDNYDDRKIHFIPGLIKKIWANPPTITLRGNGLQNRSFVYIDDQIKFINHLKDKDYDLINAAGAADIYTVKHVADTLARIRNYAGDFLYDSRYQDHSRVLLTDYEIFLGLNRIARTSLEDGLRLSLNRRSGSHGREDDRSNEANRRDD